MLAGDGDVRVHDLRPRFREGKSVSEHTQCSPVPRLLYVYPMQVGSRLCHLGHVLGISYTYLVRSTSYTYYYYVCTYYSVSYTLYSHLFEFEV